MTVKWRFKELACGCCETAEFTACGIRLWAMDCDGDSFDWEVSDLRDGTIIASGTYFLDEESRWHPWHLALAEAEKMMWLEVWDRREELFVRRVNRKSERAWVAKAAESV